MASRALDEEDALNQDDDEEHQLQKSDDSDIDNFEKLGNKLFDDSNSSDEEHKQSTHKKVLSMMDDPDLARKILLQESPELTQLLQEFKIALQ